ncbi:MULTISPECIES: DUF6221 family protein [Actinomycetes]|uniref:DUF6221 family protein n=1 Tax=Actinomycetes TaxID=1760 RepID=UPI0033F2B571
MSDDLVQFLKARLDADAAWAGDPEGVKDKAVRSTATYAGIPIQMASAALSAGIRMANGPADPHHVLADIEAKRKIIELCQAPLVEVTGPEDRQRSFLPGEGEPWGLDVLKLLATPYADHPDYRKEWRR